MKRQSKNRSGPGRPAEKRLAAVCSATRGSGVTLTAMALACVLAEDHSVSFAELGEPYVFDAYGMARTFCLSGFTDYRKLYREGETFKSPQNLWRGINWAVSPGSCPDPDAGLPVRLETGEALRFAERLPGEFSVLDCSGLEGPELERILSGCDRIYLVVDPLPGKLIPSTPRLQRLRYAFPGAVLGVNRMNEGIHRKDLDAYLGTTDYLALPDIGAKAIYRAEYACALPWDLPEGKKFLTSLKNHE